MNSTPRPPTITNFKQYPPEFMQLIGEKSANFVGREFVFSAINNFLSRHSQGYFTIVGAPGSGKSAILAKYVSENPQVIYYNAQVAGKNRAEEFLTIVCSELVRGGDRRDAYPTGLGIGEIVLPDNATSGSWFLSLLLQKISDLLAPNQKLIIAIDSLDAIDSTNLSPGANLFYLPRYLPEKVYFLLTRRPFLREKSGLLIETPSETLNLEAYPEQNREDIQSYIQQYLTPPTPQPTSPYPLLQGGGEAQMLLSAGMEEKDDSPSSRRGGGWGERLKSWLTNHHISEQEFIDQLTAKSENNFMYISKILPAIAEGFYPEPFHFDPLPPALEAYYQNHWQRIKGNEFSAVELKVLQSLVTPSTDGENMHSCGISAPKIAEIIDEDEYDVEEVLENWIEFLKPLQIDGENRYSLYHSSFEEFVKKQLILG